MLWRVDVRKGPLAPTSLMRGAAEAPTEQRGDSMKYMILTYASQQDYNTMAGQATDKPVWSAEDFAAMGAFMEAFNQDLVESGELVETRGLTAPVHTSSLSERTYFPRDSALGDRFEAKERATDALLPSRSVINRADKLLSDKLLGASNCKTLFRS